MKKRRFSLLILLSFLLTGCGIRATFTYENGDSYSIGDGSIASSISNIDIDWINGEIEINSHDKDTIDFKEEYKGTINEDNKMRYLVDGDTLKIKYRKSSTDVILLRASKKLILTVPSSIQFDSYLINSISGKVTGSLYAKDIYINGVSGGAEINVNSEALKCNFVSGDAKITFSNSPNDINVNCVSGDIKVSLPSCTGFLANFASVSGKFTVSDDFENVTKINNVYKYGDESTKINIATTSGDIEISK